MNPCISKLVGRVSGQGKRLGGQAHLPNQCGRLNNRHKLAASGIDTATAKKAIVNSSAEQGKEHTVDSSASGGD